MSAALGTACNADNIRPDQIIIKQKRFEDFKTANDGFKMCHGQQHQDEWPLQRQSLSRKLTNTKVHWTV